MKTTTSKTLHALIALAMISALTSCDKIKETVAPKQDTGNTRTPVSLDTPAGPVDVRQQQAGEKTRIDNIDRDLGTAQQEVETLIAQQEETDKVLTAMTTTVESLSKRLKQVETENENLKLRIDATSGGGFDR